MAINYLKQLKDINGNLIFAKKNETRQSFGCGAFGIELKTKTENGKTFPASNWNNFPPLKALVDQISNMSGILFNYLVIQYYPKGSTYMGPHKDKEVDDELPIVGISLGTSVRLLRLAKENHNHTAVHVQELLPRSMYQLRPPTNKNFTHAIIQSDDENERWSLNLRFVQQ